MAFDVPTTRGAYTSLSDGWTYLNAAKRAQVPERVISAMNSSFRSAPKSLPGEAGQGAHGQSRSSGVSAAEEMTSSARLAFADLTGGSVSGVVLGPSREVLMSQFTAAMSRLLTLGSNLVISRTGSQVVHAPLRRAADLYGAGVRIAEADLGNGTLPSWQFDNLIDRNTRLVVVPAADPFVGTVAPVADISRRVHARSDAWVLVDATDFAAYRNVSMTKMGADIVLVDASAFGGPEVSALVFRDPEMFARMTSLSNAPRAQGVARLEVSPVAPALLGGVSEAVQHLASLDTVARGSRRHRIERAMPQVSEYLTTLSERLIAALTTLPRVYIIGVDTEDGVLVSETRAHHIPRISFLVDGVPAAAVVGRLLDNGLVTSVLDAYESPLLEAIGIDEAGGAVGIGLQPFNTPHDIDQLVRAVASLG